MANQPRCGCPVPIINPPEFGSGDRVALRELGYPAGVPLPSDPSYRFP